MTTDTTRMILIVLTLGIISLPAFAEDNVPEKWQLSANSSECCVGDFLGGRCWKPRTDRVCYGADDPGHQFNVITSSTASISGFTFPSKDGDYCFRDHAFHQASKTELKQHPLTEICMTIWRSKQ